MTFVFLVDTGETMASSTGVMPAAFVRPLRLKYLVFAAIAMMAAYVLYHNERFLLDQAHPIWKHYEPFKWWLLPHGLAGACALLLAPMQFAEGLRRRQDGDVSGTHISGRGDPDWPGSVRDVGSGHADGPRWLHGGRFLSRRKW